MNIGQQPIASADPVYNISDLLRARTARLRRPEEEGRPPLPEKPAVVEKPPAVEPETPPPALGRYINVWA